MYSFHCPHSAVAVLFHGETKTLTQQCSVSKRFLKVLCSVVISCY